MTSRKKNFEDADEALNMIDCAIEYDAVSAALENDEEVRFGLDSMASALAAWRKPELEGASLDEVLAALDANDEAVETVAELIDMLGQASYDTAFGAAEAKQTENLRARVYDILDELLQRYKNEEGEFAD